MKPLVYMNKKSYLTRNRITVRKTKALSIRQTNLSWWEVLLLYSNGIRRGQKGLELLPRRRSSFSLPGGWIILNFLSLFQKSHSNKYLIIETFEAAVLPCKHPWMLNIFLSCNFPVVYTKLVLFFSKFESQYSYRMYSNKKECTTLRTDFDPQHHSILQSITKIHKRNRWVSM